MVWEVKKDQEENVKDTKGLTMAATYCRKCACRERLVRRQPQFVVAHREPRNSSLFSPT